MHELSIALSIIELVERQADEHHAALIEEVELEIGMLAGVDKSALEFAFESAVKGTRLENAKIVRHYIPGEGICDNCSARVPLESLCRPCPRCAAWQVRVTKGKELRVKSIVVNN